MMEKGGLTCDWWTAVNCNIHIHIHVPCRGAQIYTVRKHDAITQLGEPAQDRAVQEASPQPALSTPTR